MSKEKTNQEKNYNIMNDRMMLENTSELIKSKNREEKLIGLLIAEDILLNYNDDLSDIHNSLINTIYNNKTIAREASSIKSQNDGSSLLLLSLYNPKLELTDKQKKFAVKEAMSQFGTIKNGNNNYHGTGAFDIRYQILMNHNWSIEEKATLIYDFYKDDKLYDDTLKEWDCSVSYFNGYDYSDLVSIYGKDDASDIYEEVIMNKLCHEMRPSQQEIKNYFILQKESVNKFV